MSASGRLEEMDREERIELCREVMERLSDLVEGEADPGLCERVERLLAECQPFRAYRDTLARTIELAAECGAREASADAADEEAFRGCVERVRARLRDRGAGRHR